MAEIESHALTEIYYSLFDHDDSSSDSQGANTTCDKMTACSTCVEFYSIKEKSSCIWCTTPKEGAPDVNCLPRSKAQDNCAIEELRTSCQEGVGWYVLVLTLAALVCCCCFLTMARKFAEVWRERRGLTAGGELAHPLLGGGNGDPEEQAHEVVFRGSLVDGAGAPWRCPVCGFDNRPRCKHCDLCGINSDFAEAYWKDKNARKRADGRTKSGHSGEDGKPGPKAQSPKAPSETPKEAFAPGEPEAEDAVGATAGRGDVGRDEKESEEEVSTPLLPTTVVNLGMGYRGSVQSDSRGDNAFEGESGDDRGFGRVVGATSPGATSEKARFTPSRLRRPISLTERQKRARRRRVWQRVIGVDGKLRWLQTLESPATGLPPEPAVTPGAAAAATAAAAVGPAQGPALPARYSSSSGGGGGGVEGSSYQPPPVTAVMNPEAPNRAEEVGTGRGRGLAANATTALRYWSRPRSSRMTSTPPPRVDRAAREPLLEGQRSTAGSGQEGAGRVGGTDPVQPVEQSSRGDQLLSDAERGEGRLLRNEELMVVEDSSGRDASSHSLRQEGVAAGGDKAKGFMEEAEAVTGCGDEAGTVKVAVAEQQQLETKMVRRDSFGDEGMAVKLSGYYTTFLEGGGLAMDEARDGDLVAQPNPPPPSVTRKGPSAGEGSSSPRLRASSSAAANATTTGEDGVGTGTGPSARPSSGRGWGDGQARRLREARREEAASEHWISSTRANVAKLCDVAAKPFWQKHSWFLDQLRLLQVPHGAGMEAMRIEVNRNNILEDSFAQVSAMNSGELRRWLRVQFVGEPGVDAGGLEREWFLLVCSALFDPSSGLFTPQPGNGAFAINPSSGLANELHLEYFRFTGRVLGKLLMEHNVAPFHLSLIVLKHLLGLPVAFSDLEFADAELYRNLCWLRNNSGAASLGLDFTVTLESFGVKDVVELVPRGKHMNVTDENKDHYLQLRLKHHVLGRVHGQMWHLMRGFYDVIPSHLIWVFDYQELELLLCGIPEIDILEWKRHSRYLGDFRRLGEEHPVIKWFWEVVEEFSEEDKARFLQFCTGTSRLPPHGFKALQSNDGSFRAFSLQSITKRESAFPRAHTCFNKLDLPVYDTKKELEECLGLCICFELTGFTID